MQQPDREPLNIGKKNLNTFLFSNAEQRAVMLCKVEQPMIVY